MYVKIVKKGDKKYKYYYHNFKVNNKVKTNFNKFINKRNCLLFGNKIFFYSHKNDCCGSYCFNIKRFSNFYSNSIINNQFIFPFYCEIYYRAFSPFSTNRNIFLNFNNFYPPFINSIKNINTSGFT